MRRRPRSGRRSSTSSTGRSTIHITGGLMVAETAEELQLLHDKREIEQEAGLETHVLEGGELRQFAPYLADDLLGATCCPDEGHANPMLAAPLFALRAAQAGAELRTHAGVTSVDVDAGRRHAALHRHDRRRADPRAPDRQRGGRLGERPRGAVRPPPPDPRRGAAPQRHRAARARARADGAAHRPTADAEAVRQRTRSSSAAAGPPTRSRRRSGSRRPGRAPPGTPRIAMRVVPLLADVRIVRTWSGVMAFTARPGTDRGRVRPRPRLPHADRDDGLHARAR